MPSTNPKSQKSWSSQERFKTLLKQISDLSKVPTVSLARSLHLPRESGVICSVAAYAPNCSLWDLMWE